VVKVGHAPCTTELATQTFDDFRFRFESVSVLALDDEASDFAKPSTRSIAFIFLLSASVQVPHQQIALREVRQVASTYCPQTPDWFDKHDKMLFCTFLSRCTALL
jgi:hypothetical protein